MSDKDWMDKWLRLKIILHETVRAEMVLSVAVLPEDKENAKSHKAKFEALEAVLFTMLEMEEDAE